MSELVRSVESIEREILDDKLLAVLAERGPQSTGQLRKATGPHYTILPDRHGRNRSGGWEPCPTCQCGRVYEMGGSAAPRIRSRLLSMEKRGQVVRLEAPVRNNGGGDVWMVV